MKFNEKITSSLAVIAVLFGVFASPAFASHNDVARTCEDTNNIVLGIGWDQCRDAAEDTLTEVESFLSASALASTSYNDETLMQEMSMLTQTIQDILKSLSALY